MRYETIYVSVLNLPQSLDYDTCASQVQMQERLNTSPKQYWIHSFLRTVVAAITGVLMGCIAVFINFVIAFFSKYKFLLLAPCKELICTFLNYNL